MPIEYLSDRALGEALQSYGSPLYVYDLDLIARRYKQLQDCLPPNFRLHYALKANANLTICRRFAKLGAAAEVSSLGELITALRVGFDPEEIVFTGPGKSRQELLAALAEGVGLVVVESIGEARRLDELAAAQAVVQPVLLRVNPAFRSANSCEVRSGGADGAACDTLKPIAMNGQGASKFGVDEAAMAATLAALLEMKHLEFRGIHVFTESNVLDYRQLLAAWQNTAAIAAKLHASGIPVHTLDFGGGIGIAYNAVDEEFDTVGFGVALAEHFASGAKPHHCILEMGRYLVGEAGYYLAEVLDVKESQGQRFVILHGGIHNLYRTPAMQPASRYLRVLGKGDSPTLPAVLAGQLPTPVDVMVREVSLPEDITIGDVVAIQNCGAYGYNHSLTNFALHPYPAEVAFAGGNMVAIRDRGTYDDFFLHQKLVEI
jgi:Diaminopimelate decarboxylase